jgi:hypothetical protein
MPCPKNDRVGEDGRALKGSQKQIQTCVNEWEPGFSQRVLEALEASIPQGAYLSWMSPLANDKFNEYRDNEFLDKLELTPHGAALHEFWPSRGPCWDALAVVRADGTQGAVLVEAKSHATEMESSLGAESTRSEEKIRRALDETARDLGVAVNPNWTERYYQAANRYAHLYFLRKIAKVPAWLVNVYFVNDNSIGSPRTEQQWKVALKEVKEQMGLTGKQIPFTAELFIDLKAYEP